MNFKIEKLRNKWEDIISDDTPGVISEEYRKDVTAQLLENQESFLKEASTAPDNVTGNVAKWDPVLISLVRRAAPNMVAFDIAGVQPMSGPTGLIFAMRAEYGQTRNGATQDDEALYNEAVSGYSGAGTQAGDSSGFQTGDFSSTEPATSTTKGTGTATATGEQWGSVGGEAGTIPTMKFKIDSTTVQAKTRALKAEYSVELAQDMKAIHGLEAETELANILANEILAEINREFIRTINIAAKLGGVANATFDVSADSDGRWSIERWKGLVYHLEREANTIAKETRRGRGNIVLCSSDVASALNMVGILDYVPQFSANLTVDDTGNTFAGTINKRLKVYVDPYATIDYVTVGYKGTSPYDAGVFYCPYVPLQMVNTVGEDNFQPKIGFKTRYGIKANPFVAGEAFASTEDGGLNAGVNHYYRKFRVTNILS